MTKATDFRDLWRQAVRRYPHHTAIMEAATGARTSYAELHREGLCLARRLGEAAGAGGLLGLRIGDRRRFCVALLGAWLADAVPVPLGAAAPDGYVRESMRRVGTRIVLAEDAAAPGGIAVSSAWPDAPLVADIGPTHDLAYVMRTSGSTGMPKWVGMSRRALAAYCGAFATATGLGSEDRFLQVAPVTFDVVFEELLPIWSVGGMAVLAPGTPEDPARLLTVIDGCGVTVAELTTVYWRLLVRHLRSAPALPRSLRLLLVGGEPADADLINASLSLGMPLGHVYGVTEAGITSTIEFFRSRRPVTAVSVGTPLPNTTVCIVDAAGNPVGPEADGEIWIGGDSLADRYLGMPQETERSFVVVSDGPLAAGRYYRTGDIGRMAVDGSLEILARVDDEVKVNGIRVDLKEIESVLASSSLVTAAAVVAVQAPDRTRHLHGFVVAAGHADTTRLTGDLRQWLAERLPAHLAPRRLHVVDAIPVTDHGKTDRLALAGMCDISQEVTEIGARTGTERLVTAAWTAAIGRTPTSLDQSFGDAGGTSLALPALVVSLAEHGLTVTPTDCLTYPTVRALAAFLDRPGGQPASDAGARLREQQRQYQRSKHLRERRAAHRNEP